MTHTIHSTAGSTQAEYFVLDDVIDDRGQEGFIVMAGDPFDARGFECFKARTLRECLAYLLPQVTRGEIVYRVKLARRHGVHEVSILLGGRQYHPFRDHGLWQTRGYDIYGKHFNRAWRVRREAERFLRAMRRTGCEMVEHY